MSDAAARKVFISRRYKLYFSPMKAFQLQQRWLLRRYYYLTVFILL